MSAENEKRIELRNQDYYNNLADKLDELQKVKNEGRGVSCVRDIITYLRRGYIRSAKDIVYSDSDKIDDLLGRYKDIKQLLIEELFEDGEQDPWSVSDRWNKSLNK